jgi:RNA polymerase sigma factor (sigma-70 family)
MSAEDIQELYECLGEDLRKLFLGRTRDCEVTADLMQELYTRLLEHRPPKVLRNPANYLFKVAWNVLNEYARAQQHLPSVSFDPAVLDQLATEHRQNRYFDDGATGLETLEELERALASLQWTDRVAIILQRRDGLSYKAIAAHLGVTQHTVKKYIGRALRQLNDFSHRARSQKSTPDD